MDHLACDGCWQETKTTLFSLQMWKTSKFTQQSQIHLREKRITSSTYNKTQVALATIRMSIRLFFSCMLQAVGHMTSPLSSNSQGNSETVDQGSRKQKKVLWDTKPNKVKEGTWLVLKVNYDWHLRWRIGIQRAWPLEILTQREQEHTKHRQLTNQSKPRLHLFSSNQIQLLYHDDINL